MVQVQQEVLKARMGECTDVHAFFIAESLKFREIRFRVFWYTLIDDSTLTGLMRRKRFEKGLKQIGIFWYIWVYFGKQNGNSY